jgi:6-phosphogluconolactonase
LSFFYLKKNTIMKAAFTLLMILTGLFAKAQTYNLLIGTYTNKGNSEGIYTYSYNPQTGEATKKHVAKQVINPSYLTIATDKKFAYSVNENGDKSEVSAFAYKNGELTFLNKVDSRGADPCYLISDAKHVIVANYSGGTIAVFGRKADGKLSDAKQIIKHTGKSIDPKKRQESAHVHMVYFTPDKKYIISNDLGEDRIYVYSYHANAETNVLSLKNVYSTTAGSGPRHLSFSTNGKFAYVAHEFTGQINSYVYRNGTLKKIQQINTVAKDFKGAIDGADIHTSADGKFLYQTNRGDANTISVFAILPTGILRFVQTISTLGKGPRNFTLSPNGKQLLIAHQYTNEVVIFNRNTTSGKLTDSGKRINVGTPVCLVFDKG